MMKVSPFQWAAFNYFGFFVPMACCCRFCQCGLNITAIRLK